MVCWTCINGSLQATPAAPARLAKLGPSLTYKPAWKVPKYLHRYLSRYFTLFGRNYSQEADCHYIPRAIVYVVRLRVSHTCKTISYRYSVDATALRAKAGFTEPLVINLCNTYLTLSCPMHL